MMEPICLNKKGRQISYRQYVKNSRARGLDSIQLDYSLSARVPEEHNFSTGTVHDVYGILLSLKLPSEIVIEVLEFAEIWATQTWIREERACLTAWHKYNRSTPPLFPSPAHCQPYIQTEPIGIAPQMNGVPFDRLKKVSFRIVTGDIDRGPVADEYLNEDYWPSADEAQAGPRHRSWLDVTIYREDNEWSEEERLEDSDRLEPAECFAKYSQSMQCVHCESWNPAPQLHPAPWLRAGIPVVRNGLKLRGGFEIVPNGDREHWFLQMNRVYKSTRELRDLSYNSMKLRHESLKRTIEWYPEEQKGRYFQDICIDTGGGSGNGFVSALQRGDRIMVWAHAVSDGLKCTMHVVQSVEVILHFAIF